MTPRNWPWTELDIDPVNDERAVKRAYAIKLKAIDPETDANRFIELRAAYDYALSMAKGGYAEYTYDDEIYDEDYDEKAEQEAQPIATVIPAAVEEFNQDEDKPYRYEQPEDSGYTEEEPYRYQSLLPDLKYTVPAQQASENSDPDLGISGQDIAAAMDTLAALHQFVSAADVDELAVQQAFKNVVASPDLDNILIASRIEGDLATMIQQFGRKAYFLAELADHHFGWSDRAHNFGLEWPMDGAQRAASASRFFRHIDRGTPRNERERLYIEAMNWLEQGPNGWFFIITERRHKRVLEFAEALEINAPDVYYGMDQVKIAAWRNLDRNLSAITWPMGSYMALSTIVMSQFLTVTGGPNQLWIMSGLWGICAAFFLAALLYRQPKIAPAPAYYGDYVEPISRQEAWAYGALLLLIPLSLLGPPHLWTLVILAAGSAAAVAHTRHWPLPVVPEYLTAFDERRYAFGAMYLAVASGFSFASWPGLYLFMPTAAAAWACAHGHARFQAQMQMMIDGQTAVRLKVRRWHLQAAVFVIAALLFAALCNQHYIFGVPQPNPLLPPSLLTAATIIMVLCHDAITPRHIIVMGTQIYIGRIIAISIFFFAPALAMLLFVIVRTAGVLIMAARSARLAKAEGRAWFDDNGGVQIKSNTEGWNINWKWIMWAVLGLNLLRLLARAVG
jgi:hypothetical protein